VYTATMTVLVSVTYFICTSVYVCARACCKCIPLILINKVKDKSRYDIPQSEKPRNTVREENAIQITII